MMVAKKHNENQASLRGELKLQEPMSRYTSWRVGGPADRFYKPADIEDLAEYLRQRGKDEPVFWLGLGSNLLVRDGGIRGSVIATQGVIDALEQIDENTVRAEVGVSCAKVARYCARLSLTGVEFLAGIPGTMGGALAMNAGAFGGETWAAVTAVETLNRNGERMLRAHDEYEIGYRTVKGPADEWFIAAHLRLQQGDTDKSQQHIKALLEKRGQTQPIGLPSCGSVFRNPEGDHAARLIESAGLKGMCIGNACVSDKHANFIINTGNASAADIESLIKKIEVTVEQLHGVKLEREVRIVGEPATDSSNSAGDDECK
jgi:UDP-N-acetylmuramate dehydrogenase